MVNVRSEWSSGKFQFTRTVVKEAELDDVDGMLVCVCVCVCVILPAAPRSPSRSVGRSACTQLVDLSVFDSVLLGAGRWLDWLNVAEWLSELGGRRVCVAANDAIIGHRLISAERAALRCCCGRWVDCVSRLTHCAGEIEMPGFPTSNNVRCVPKVVLGLCMWRRWYSDLYSRSRVRTVHWWYLRLSSLLLQAITQFIYPNLNKNSLRKTLLRCPSCFRCHCVSSTVEKMQLTATQFLLLADKMHESGFCLFSGSQN